MGLRILVVGSVITYVLCGCGRTEVKSPELFSVPSLLLTSVRALTTPTVATGAARPIILVPGWGWNFTKYKLTQPVFAGYIQWLINDGVPAQDIYVVDYGYAKDLDTIKGQMIPAFQKIISSYPADTKFDVMGHSEGGFTGLYTIMEGNFSNRIQKFVSLSGIPQGWDNWYCKTGICGKAHLDLIPYHSTFVVAFLNQYADQIHGLQKCSIYSPDDGFVKPYDAGKFSDGTNVDVPGMHHMATIWDEQFYHVMRSHCYP
jgi:pimeloyl-ACP methyl ester carboxylesterase